jgi:hypothetical protein
LLRCSLAFHHTSYLRAINRAFFLVQAVFTILGLLVALFLLQVCPIKCCSLITINLHCSSLLVLPPCSGMRLLITSGYLLTLLQLSALFPVSKMSLSQTAERFLASFTPYDEILATQNDDMLQDVLLRIRDEWYRVGAGVCTF